MLFFLTSLLSKLLWGAELGRSVSGPASAWAREALLDPAWLSWRSGSEARWLGPGEAGKWSASR